MRNKYHQVSHEAVTTLNSSVREAAKRIDAVVEPGRSGFARRYPTVFSMLVTFGVAATFLGFEQLLLAFDILERYPLLIFMLGIGILALTGTLYKKMQ